MQQISELTGLSPNVIMKIALLLVVVSLAGVVLKWAKKALKFWLILGLVVVLAGGWTVGDYLNKSVEGAKALVGYAQQLGREGDIKIEDNDVKIRIKGLDTWISLQDVTIKTLDKAGAAIQVGDKIYSVTDPLVVKALNDYRDGTLEVGK